MTFHIRWVDGVEVERTEATRVDGELVLTTTVHTYEEAEAA